jgi:glutaredoxin
MQPGSKAIIKDIAEEGGLYKITINLPGGQEITSYLTRDGKKFFPEAMDIAEVEAKVAQNKNQQADNNQNPASQNVTVAKKDKPEVELFIMSHCPYGTQIEKGLLPVLSALGDKIDFKLKFCSYAMHGEKELDEQLNQYCIQKEEPAKLANYLKCFLEDGNSDRCATATGLNKGKIKSCIASADKEFKVKEKYKDQSTWVSGRFPAFDVFKADNEKYGVQGSPTLIINGQQIQTGRDSASLLSAICSTFNNQPAECQQQLSGAAPSPGFGSGTGGANSAGGCAN